MAVDNFWIQFELAIELNYMLKILQIKLLFDSFQKFNHYSFLLSYLEQSFPCCFILAD